MKLSIVSRGFTLVEMLVSIAILVLMTGIIITSLMPAQSKSRDAKRTADLAQIQLALEQYFDNCKQYPPSSPLSLSDGTGCPSGITLKSYLSVMPTPPSGGSLNQTIYDYLVNPVHTDYILHIQLEGKTDLLKSSLLLTDLSSFSNGYSVTAPIWSCYDSTASTYNFCLGPK